VTDRTAPSFSFLYLTTLALVVVFTCCACINDPADVAGLRDQLSDKVEAADSIRIIFSDSGMVRAIIEAPVMMNYLEKSDQRQEFPNGLHATFYDDFNNPTSTLVAKWGVYRSRNRNVTVRDSVVWESTDLQKLETEELNWDEKTGRIHTNKFVVLRQPDYVIYGYGLEADQGLANAKVLQVDGRVPLSRPKE
jgi:LPS export ABC transporter protein LptC